MALSDVVLEVVLANKYYIVLASVVLYLAQGYYADYHRLKAFKGPWLARYSDLWFGRETFGVSQHLVLADVCAKYGKIAVLGPNTLVTTSPELYMRMSAARSPYTKSPWYKAAQFPPGRDNILSQQDEEKHTKRKAQMAEGYSGKTNPSLEPAISSHVQNFINLIKTRYLSTETEFKPMDMGMKSAYFTMDVITDVAFGQPFGNLVDDVDRHGYIEFNEDMIPAIMRMAAFPTLRAIFQGPIGTFLFPSDTSPTGVGKLMGVAKKLASSRYAARDTNIRQDMLSSFIAHGLSEHDLVAESVLQILAGADTTATAIRAMFLHVITNPRVYRTLQADIDAIVKARGLGDEIVSGTVAKELPYLQAVIRESLRIWPPVTGLLAKLSPPRGDTFTLSSGEVVNIPGGVQIGGSIWGLMRDKSIFGADAEIFRPERWLDVAGAGQQDKSRVAKMVKVLDLGFGHGKYYCLGQNVAWLEMNKLTFELMRRFDWDIVKPDSPWKSVNVGLWLQKEMWVRITERTGLKV